MNRLAIAAGATALAIGIGFAAADADAQPLALFAPSSEAPTPFDRIPRGAPPATEQDRSAAPVPAHLRRQIVRYATREAPGTIVVDTPNTYLYYVLGDGRAVRYGIGVGREGFTFSGVKNVGRMAEWPDWRPPAEMIERQPYLPRWMAGGPGNPLGARALYLAGTLYRIHGTNDPSSIGQRVSSGCIRMLNEDVTDLYERVRIGTRVVVKPDAPDRDRQPDTAMSRQQRLGFSSSARTSQLY